MTIMVVMIMMMVGQMQLAADPQEEPFVFAGKCGGDVVPTYLWLCNVFACIRSIHSASWKTTGLS